MKTIKVSVPVYDARSGDGTIKITDDIGGNATLIIDFKTLLPFVNLINEEVLDFFILSAAVYGIDRFVERKQNSVDGWSRELKVNFPVHNPTKWDACKDELDKLLSFLTGDYWDVDFRKAKFDFPKAQLDKEFSQSFTQVNLLSGGLDSLIGALDFLKLNPKDKILFVSHYDPQMKGALKDQETIIERLNLMYPDQFSYIPSLRVSLKHTNRSRETTFRSRSLLFVGIALLAAQATNNRQSIIVPENGTVSLNFPLSTSRRSSCSTRTTHPFVLEKVLSIWSLLSISTNILNPYEFKTKGEMIAACKDQANLSKLVAISNSCGKRGHRAHWEPGKKNASHCGICMPCIYRQAALFDMINDITTYGNSINNLPPFKNKKSQDTAACLDFLKDQMTKAEIKQELIVSGVKNLSKLNQYVDVVWRTRKELSQWVKEVGNSEVKVKAGV